VKDLNGNYFQTWAAVKNAYIGLLTSFVGTNDVENGYMHIARAASSFITGVSDQGLSGLTAWNWMTANVGGQNYLNDNPKWAIVPRNSTGPVSNVSCDLNGDGVTNQSDV